MSPRNRSKAQISGPAAGDDLSRHLLKAQEEERRRISRELHDETGQALMVLRFQLEMLAGESGGKEQKARTEEALELLDRTIEGLRRTIARLSPRVLEELGLIAAIRRQAKLLARHAGIKPRLNLPESLSGLDHDLEVALYRSVQEALHNVAKHSHAAHCIIRLASSGGRITLHIEDDGAGFSPRAAHQRGFGLKGMRERAAALGGSMRVRSEAGKGTLIRIVLPVAGTGGRTMSRTSAA